MTKMLYDRQNQGNWTTIYIPIMHTQYHIGISDLLLLQHILLTPDAHPDTPSLLIWNWGQYYNTQVYAFQGTILLIDLFNTFIYYNYFRLGTYREIQLYVDEVAMVWGHQVPWLRNVCFAPIHVTCVFIDCRWKPEHPEENPPHKHKEKTQTLSINDLKCSIRDSIPGPSCCEVNVLHTYTMCCPRDKVFFLKSICYFVCLP